MRRFVVFLAAALATAALCAGPEGEVKKVVLYKQGLGYIEKEFEVDGEGVIELTFDESQVPDVLNSLVVVDLSGKGIITNVEYESKTPREKLLKEVFGGHDVSGLCGMLRTFKGAQAEVTAGGKRLVGRLAGVEKYQRSEKVESWRIAMVLSDGKVVAFDVGEISGLSFSSKRLQADLEKYLSLYSEAFKTRCKTIRIHHKGKGKRKIRACYTVELPVWKTTHRFVVKDKKALIQSWAIVDNTTLEDWKDVEMVLASGVPVVFRYDLYSPIYTKRQTLAPRTAQAAPLPEEGKPFAKATPTPSRGRSFDSLSNKSLDAKKFGAEGYGVGGGRAGAYGARWGHGSLSRTIRAAATAARLGCFFVYRIRHPVTVASKRSAMIPIATGEVPVRRLLTWRYGSGLHSPYQAVEVTNSTGAVLDAGPVSVFEQDNFLGNSLAGRLEPGRKGLLRYALEQGVRVDRLWREPGSRRVSSVVAGEGVLRTYFWVERTLVLTLRNDTSEKKTLLVEYPVEAGWEVTGVKPAEREGWWRFEVTLEAGKTKKFEIRLRGGQRETVALGDFDEKKVDFYVSKGWLTKEQEAKFQALFARRRAVTRMRARRDRLEARRKSLYTDQARLRENLRSLTGSSSSEQELRNFYVKRLRGQEDELATLQSNLRQAESDYYREFEEYQKALQEFSFENKVK